MELQVRSVTERPQSVLCVVVCIIVSFLLHREPDSPTARHPSTNRRTSVADHLQVSWWKWRCRELELGRSCCLARPSDDHS